MLSVEIIDAELAECDQIFACIKVTRQDLSLWAKATRRRRKALASLLGATQNASAVAERVAETMDGLQPTLFPPLVMPAEMERLKSPEAGRKPATQDLEELLAEFGPIHLTDILLRAKAKGLSLAGKQHAKATIRVKLAQSKRFVNFGNNVWGLPGQAVN